MNFKKSIAYAIAICAVFMFTGVAFANNHVTLKTTVPNIAKSECDQAGTITMELDSGTKMQSGDVIQFTLNNDVTACKAIDYFLALADDGPLGSIISIDPADPVTTNGASPAADLIKVTSPSDVTSASAAATAFGSGALAIDGSAATVGFRVYAQKGSQIVTMTLGYLDPSDKFRTVTATNSEKFVVEYVPTLTTTILSIKLFDEKIGGNYFFKSATSPSVAYDQNIALEDNVICINTINFSYEYVGATPDSIVASTAYKLGFSGDYTIAHVVAATAYVVQNVCKDACNTVEIASSTDQFGFKSKPSGVFDSGVYSTLAAGAAGLADRWTSTGTCDLALGNGVILRKVGDNFVANQIFTVKLELLIDGIAADDSVVWWDSTFTGGYVYDTTISNAGRCSSAGTPMTAGTLNSSVVAANATILNTEITAGSAHDSFVIDLPQVHYDYTKLVAGAKLEVKVTFGKYPCGGTTVGTMCLATFVNECATAAGTYSLLYPFATGSSNASFWSGIVVTNTSMNAVNATITLYDTKGGSGSLAVSMDAKAQYTKMIGDIVSAATFVNGTTALDTASDVQVEVTADDAVDGIMFVGGTGVMHGYLPRVFVNGVVQH
ncbi:hypothetical protein HRM2_30050 [Desulforapulum autotrophicum HRM2]|uniref:Uncharacterized protein n=1 Tax=Desulforapulum autotrophicum (strain ATCC 43914 / DSM 3382 / VKM B-1955 / HRM2) TaxID=177437 RepID=C0QK62_DESAH|nr:hypothetical protein [Desulforapulum autotrophicum]ACN16088.1 hypothetical protein HRM2_30050 [Desulforapulum autotrophicum HRM2]